MNKDLTTEKPSTVLRRFCLPLFASVIFQQLYNIADSLVAGKFINNDALAAVGNSYEITLVFLAFAFGCNIGCSVIVANLFGSKNYRDMKSAVYTALLSTGGVCLVLMALGFTLGDTLLGIIKTPASLFADSALYLRIYVGGLPFVLFYNIANGIFSALGDSRTPFWFLACSSVANIGMDILFVAVFRMGVSGVAWATFICQGISCLLAMWVIFRRLQKIPVSAPPVPFSLPLFKRMAVVAVPSIFQQSFISVGNIILQGIINGFGTAVIAGYSASVKLNNMVITSMTTLGNGISSFTAQNLGAGKPDRVSAGFRSGLRMVLCICLPVAVIYWFAGRYLVFIFLDSPTGAAVDTGVAFLRTIAPFYVVVAAKLVADGILRGDRLMKQVMIATFSDLLLRVILAFVLSKTSLGTTGIWISWPVGWFVGAVLSLLFYKTARFHTAK